MHRFVAVGVLVLTLSASAFAGPGWSGGPEYIQMAIADEDDTQQLAIDAVGNVYIADASARCIRKWPAGGGATSIVAGIQNQSGFTGDGGQATSAKLNNPHGIAIDASGNLYIADTGNHRIRKVDTTGVITTIAGTGTAGHNGDGTATTRHLNSPRGVTIDVSGNIWIADTSNHRIRRLSGTTLTTFAGTGTSGFDGDGVAVNKRLNGPYGVYASGTDVLIADTSNNRIRKLDDAGNIATIAGGGSSTANDAPATNASLSAPRAVCRDAAGFVFIANTGAGKVLRVDTDGFITNLSFDAGTASPSGIITGASNVLFFSASAATRKCRHISPPVIVTGPAANPNPATGTTAALSVTAEDDAGEAMLTYTWSRPNGPAAVNFSPNNTNAAKNSTATFTAPGSYTLRVEVEDQFGDETQVNFSVTVNDTLTITVTPNPVSVPPNGTQQFSASAQNQFGQPRTPSYAWSVNGGGSINQSGLFTAGVTAGGPHTVTAEANGYQGTAAVTVVNAAPTVATAAAANPSPVTGTTTTLSSLGADDGGEANLTYTWSTLGTPPASVNFNPNGSNAAKSSVATFTELGAYSFRVTITDGTNSVTSDVNVTVNDTLTISVTPDPVSLPLNGTQQFSASAQNQFSQPRTPTYAWSVNGGGSIDQSGLFTAGATAGGPHTVTAEANGYQGTAAVTIVNTAPTVATAAAANPSPVTGTTTTLSALGADDGGEANLTYTWSTLGTPPASVNFNPNGNNAAKSSTATFAAAGSYSFRVTIADGVNSVVSDVIVEVPDEMTGVPSVTAPGGAGNGVTPTFEWTAVGNAQFYELAVDDLTGNSQDVIRETVSTLYYTPFIALANNHSYRVTVRAKCWNKVTAWSVPVPFATGTAPLAAPATAPVVNAPTGVENIARPVFQWSAVADATTYDLRVVDTTSNSEVLRQIVTGVSYTPPVSLGYSRSFSTTVRAGNPFGYSAWSDAVAFSTMAPPALPPEDAPIVTSPQGSLVAQQPVFEWTSVETATSYELLVEDVVTSVQVLAELCNETKYTATANLTGGHEHRARVRAQNAFGPGPWSTYLHFTTIPENVPPTVATAASANPNPVTAATCALSVLGADEDGEPLLTYTWSVLGTPPGFVDFSPNASNAARNCTATFVESGEYAIRVTIRDRRNGSVSSTVNLTVVRSPATIEIVPANPIVGLGAAQQFSGTIRDQFGSTLTGNIDWSVSGGGSINVAGMFTAATVPGGPYTVTATHAGVEGTTAVTVANLPPSVTAGPSANPNPVTGTTADLSVSATDDAGEPNLTYHWSVLAAPAAVDFSINGTNEAKNTVATFHTAGQHQLRVTVRDAYNLEGTANLIVQVQSTPATINLYPENAILQPQSTLQFLAVVVNQFGEAVPPTGLTWEVTGGQAISNGGLFTAAGTAGGPYTVTVSGGAALDTATITVETFVLDPVISTEATVTSPQWIVRAPSGVFYIATGHRIKKLQNGVLTDFVGTGVAGYSGDFGPALDATLRSPKGCAVDSNGNLYIADTSNHVIRRVDNNTGIIQTIAGTGFSGSGTGDPLTSELNSPNGVTVGSDGSVYIADTNNHRICKLDAAFTNLEFLENVTSASSIAVNAAHDLYIVSSIIGTLYKKPNQAPLETLVQMPLLNGIDVAPDGTVRFTDRSSSSSRAWKIGAGGVEAIAGDGTTGFSGDGGPATAAQLNLPRGICGDGGTGFLIADTANGRIRRVLGGTLTLQGILADPNPVGPAFTSDLTALTGATGLTFYWSAIGPAAVQFSINGGTSPNTTATFSAEGDYTLRVDAVDAGGHSVNASQSIKVSDAAPWLAPAKVNVVENTSGNPATTRAVAVGNAVYYSSAEDPALSILFRTTGSRQSTQPVSDTAGAPTFSTAQPIVGMNGVLYFLAAAGGNGSQLWRTDGTRSGTHLVKDLQPGASGSIAEAAVIGNWVYFAFQSQALGTELWRTDGTLAGTDLVQDIRSGPASSTPSGFTQLNGDLYFTADNGTAGRELFRHSPDENLTWIVKDIQPGGLDGVLGKLVTFNGKLYFAANDGVNGLELWSSDGTSGSTQMLKDIFPGSSGSDCAGLAVSHGKLYFAANSGGGEGCELWSSDGSAPGTELLKDLESMGSSSPMNFVSLGSVTLFSASHPDYGAIWKTDGTAVGTVKVANHYYGVPPFTVFNNQAYFTGYGEPPAGPFDYEPWRTDGTYEETRELSNIEPNGWSQSPGDYRFTAGPNNLYFTATRDLRTEMYALGATAYPNPCYGSSVELAVNADDDGGEANLVYTWQVLGTPPGPVNLSPYGGNGTNDAKNASASFTAYGTYQFRVTITDPHGQSRQADVTVEVKPATIITVYPQSLTAGAGDYQFHAVVRDQHGLPLNPQPQVTWEVDSGHTIEADGLLHYAGGTVGVPVNVRARIGDSVGTATVNFDADYYLVATPNPAPNLATAIQLRGPSTDGCVLVWSGSPGTTILPPGIWTDNQRDVNVSFASPGAYTISVEINSNGQLVDSASMVINAVAGGTRIQITPAPVEITPGATQQFTAVLLDHLDVPLPIQPSIQWEVTGHGTISPTGLYTAPNFAGVTAVVSATASGPYGGSAIIGIAGVTVTNTAPIYLSGGADPNPVTGNTTQLSVAATDDGGEENLVYQWSVADQVGVTFLAPNEENASKLMPVQFTRAGQHTFHVVVIDQGGRWVSSPPIVVEVPVTLTSIAIDPESVQLAEGQSIQFTCLGYDQFGGLQTGALAANWSCSRGMINTAGRFSPNDQTGNFLITATVGALQATANVSTIADDQAPTAPVLDVLDKTDSSVDLAWSASTDDHGIGKYVILRNGDVLSETTKTTFTDTSPTGLDCSYMILAYDNAMNVSPPSNEAFVSFTGGTPPKIKNLTVDIPPSKKRVDRPNKILTNSESATIKFSIEGGKNPLAVKVNGTNAGSNRTIEAPVSGLPEAEMSVMIEVTDADGLVATDSVTIVSDRSPPALQVLTPMKRVTADLLCLILGKNDIEVYDKPEEQDPDAMRNVFNADTFAPEVEVRDDLAGPAEVKVEVFFHKMEFVDIHKLGIFHDFAADADSRRTAKPAVIIPLPGEANIKRWKAEASVATGLEEYALESDRETQIIDANGAVVNLDNLTTWPAFPLNTGHYKKYNKSYQLFITVKDAVGNEHKERIADFIIDKTPPKLRAHRVFSPVISIDTDRDVYRVKQAGSNPEPDDLRKQQLDPYFDSIRSKPTPPFYDRYQVARDKSTWRLKTPIAFEDTDEGVEIEVIAEDLAGNTSDEVEPSFTAYRLPLKFDAGMWANFALVSGPFEDLVTRRPIPGDKLLIKEKVTDDEAVVHTLPAYELFFEDAKVYGYYRDPNDLHIKLTSFYAGDGSPGKITVQYAPPEDEPGPVEIPFKGPIFSHPPYIFPNPLRIVASRSDEMGSPTKMPGRVHEIEIPRADGLLNGIVWSKAGINYLELNFQSQFIDWGTPDAFDGTRFIAKQVWNGQPFQHSYTPGQGGSSETVTIKPNGMGPVFVTSKAPLSADLSEAEQNPLPPVSSGDQIFKIRLANIGRGLFPGFVGFEYILRRENTTDDYPSYPGTPPERTPIAVNGDHPYLKFTPGQRTDQVNSLHVAPSNLVAGKRQTFLVLGAELGWPGETDFTVQFKHGSTDVTAPAGTLPAAALDKVIVHKVTPIYYNNPKGTPEWFYLISQIVEGLAHKPEWLAGGLLQAIKVDVTAGADLQLNQLDLVLTTPGGLTGFKLPEVLNVIKLNLTADANHDGAIDGLDDTREAANHGVVFASGFGVTNHLQVNERIKVKLGLDNERWGSGEYYLQVDKIELTNSNPAVKIYDAETEGTQLTGDGLKWIRPDGDEAPEFIFLEFQGDGETELTLSYLHTFNGDDQETYTSSLKVVRLSNGLGRDSLSPHHSVVPGFASVGLTRGNLHFGSTVRRYETPLLNPDVYVSYNNLDGFVTGLGTGWRTNYDLKIFDASVDADGDGVLETAERVQGDLLALIDETGRRTTFEFNDQSDKFLARPGSGLIGAFVEPNKEEDGFVAGDEKRYEYRLVRHDNRVHYFNKQGWLERIEALNGDALTITRDKNGHAVCVADSYQRSESLLRISLGSADSGVAPLGGLNGRQSAKWTFQYAGQDLGRRMTSMSLSGFTGNDYTYTIGYDNEKRRVESVTQSSAPQAVQFVYTEIDDAVTSATVTGALNDVHEYDVNADVDMLERYKDPAQIETTLTIDDQTRRVSESATGRYHVTYGYDGKGNLTSRSVQGGASETYEYESLSLLSGNVLKKSTLSGAGATNYTYEASGKLAGLLKTESNADGVTTYARVPATGFVSSIIDKRGKVWTVTERNDFGQPTLLTSPGGKVLTKSYNYLGQCLASTDLLGYTTRYRYDGRGRLEEEIGPGGVSSRRLLDPLGRVLLDQQPGTAAVTTEYDWCGRPKNVAQSGIGATAIEYGVEGLFITAKKTRGGIEVTDKYNLGGQKRFSSRKVVTLPEYEYNEDATTEHKYSPEGWLEEVVDPRGGKTILTYNDAGRVTSIKTPAGGVTTMEYNAPGWLTARTDPDGNRSTFAYGPTGRVTAQTNSAGHSIVSGFDSAGNVTSVNTSDGLAQTFGFNADGLHNTTTDVLNRQHTTELLIAGASRQIREITGGISGRTVTTALDYRGIPSSVKDAVGTTRLRLLDNGQTKSVTPPGLGTFGNEIDELGRVTGTSMPQGISSSTTYDPSTGLIANHTSTLGLRTVFEREVESGEVKKTTEFGGTQALYEAVERDANGNVTKYKDAGGRVWVKTYDADNRCKTVTAPDGIVTTTTYTPAGRVESVKIGAQAPTAYVYNRLGQPTTITDPTGRVTRIVYDNAGRKLSETSGGLTTTYQYNGPAKALSAVVMPGGRTISYLHDAHGRVTRMTDPKGYHTNYTYDDLDRQTRVDHADTKYETFTYSAAHGLLQEHRDRGARITNLIHDELGRVTSKSFGADGMASYTYNSAGQVLTETFGSTLTRTYDNRGRVTSITQPSGEVSLTYNNDDTLKDKMFGGTTLTHNYAPNGRMTGVTHTYSGGTASATFGHDAVGRINSYTLPNNVTRSMIFDAAGRTTSMTQTVNGVAENFSYGYDAAGRVTTLNKGGAESYTLAFTYDAAGRLASEKRTGVGAYVHNYNYDANDNRTGQTTVIGGEVTAHVLNFGQATPEVIPVTGAWNIAAGTLNGNKPDTGLDSARVNVNVGANALLPITVKVQPDIGEITTSVSSFSAITFGEQGDTSRYAAGLYVIKNTIGGNDVLQRQLKVLWIDAAGVAEVVGVAPPRSYSGEQLTLSYELVNGDIAVSVVEDGVGVPPLLVEPTHSTGGVVGLELRGPQDVEFFGQFDDFTWRTATGGTVVKGWSYNNMNQLTAINEGGNTETFEYDDLDLGLLARRKVNNVPTTEYTYDRLDRMTIVTDLVGEITSAYSYAGASWMRNSATVNDTTTTHFVYDGSKVVTQTAGGVATHYLGLWERENAPTPANLTHAIDGMGNITGIVGAAGYTQKFNFDAWGNFTATDGNGDPIAKTNGPRYRGYQYDAATDQYATGWRPYMPSLGRFGSLDPMGTPDGPNRYNYCAGDPVNRSDPMGLFWEFTVSSDEDNFGQLVARWNDESDYGDPQKPPMADGPSLAEIEAAEKYFMAGGDGTYSAIQFRMVGAFAGANTLGDINVAGMNAFPMVSLGGNYFVPKSAERLPGGSLNLNDLEPGGFSAFYITELDNFVRNTGQFGDGTISPFVGQLNLMGSAYGFDAQSAIGGSALAKYAVSPEGRGKSLLIVGGSILAYKFAKSSYGRAVGQFAAKMGERFSKTAMGEFMGDALATANGAPMSVFQMSGAPESMRDQIDRAIRNGQLRPQRPPRHHVFPQEERAWFKSRGVEIDDYTLELDSGTHSALHYGSGGGFWNKEIMDRLLKEEARQGRALVKRDILRIGNQMRRDQKLSKIKVIPYKD